MTDGPLSAYRARLQAGGLAFDPLQALAAEKLQSLHNALKGYEPSGGRTGWARRLGLARRTDPPQGLYLFGPVGTGKSMLMDIFFEASPVAAKRRAHFHAFMQEVHARLHAWRRESAGEQDDPLPRLAGAMAQEAWLFCFDEFQVVNIADAMILGRLFEALFDHGAVVVATSNTPPDRLYEEGLQRDNVLPFIDLLTRRLDVLELDGGLDYRMQRLRQLAVYHSPLDGRAEAALQAAFDQLTEGAIAAPASLNVQGRRLELPAAARGVARIAFAELCGRPLGAADYLALARQFHTLVLSGVPRMTPDQRNEARRFMILVDVLYEQRVNLIVSAEAAPDELYRNGPGSKEFRRTASRLIEMRSADYIAAPHLVEGAGPALARLANSE